MGLFTSDAAIVRAGASYLQIVGPIYGLYGLAMALYFATQGFGSVVWTVTANAVRLLASAGFALLAIIGSILAQWAPLFRSPAGFAPTRQ